MALGSQLLSGRDVHANAPRQHIETASKANPVTRLSIEILSIILSFIHDDEESRSTLFLPFLRVSKAWMVSARMRLLKATLTLLFPFSMPLSLKYIGISFSIRRTIYPQLPSLFDSTTHGGSVQAHGSAY
jgi:hypothetical protein